MPGMMHPGSFGSTERTMILVDHLFRRYQVFISSTFKDLEKERTVVRAALSKHNYIVEGMELFPATDRKQWEVIKDRIDRSDIYVLIIAESYGSSTTDGHAWEPKLVGPGERVSYTQLEFRYALHRRIPVLAFIKGQRGNDQDVERFTKEVQSSGLTTDYWVDIPELVVDILSGLSEKARSETFAAGNGWVKAPELHHPIDHSNRAVFLGSKMHYVKFVSHAQRTDDRAPLYRKRIHRVDKEFDVWDEYNAITVNCFSHCLNAYKFYTRTQGDAVDFTVLFPYVDKLTFSDVKEGLHDKVLNPTIEAPSNVYAVATSYLNGFQKGNTDIGTKATHPARVMRLVADFSSLADHDKRFRLAGCVQVDPSEKEEDIMSEVRSTQPGIHMVERLNVPVDHVIKFKFDLIG